MFPNLGNFGVPLLGTAEEIFRRRGRPETNTKRQATHSAHFQRMQAPSLSSFSEAYGGGPSQVQYLCSNNDGEHFL